MELTSENIKKFKDILIEKLLTNDKWLIRGLDIIASKQTLDEFYGQNTYEVNNVGFNKTDAKLLTSIHCFYQDRKFLSEKQKKIVRKKLPKYWRQLIAASNQESFEQILRNEKLINL